MAIANNNALGPIETGREFEMDSIRVATERTDLTKNELTT